MIIQLPVCYCALVRTPSGEWRSRRLMRTVQADITEVDPKDCEISAENLDFGSESRFTTLFHDGSNWLRETPSTSGFGRTYVEKFDPEDVRHMAILIRGHSWRGHLAGCDWIGIKEAEEMCERWLERGMPAASKFAMKEARDSWLEAETQRVFDYVRNIRMIDGYLYRRIPVPYFRIEDGKAKLDTDREPGPSGGFKLTRLDDLLSHLVDHCGQCSALACAAPIVRLPHAFEWDDEGVSFDKATAFAQEFVRRHGSDGYGDRQRANGRLARAISRVQNDDSANGRDELADELEEFAKVHGAAKIESIPMAISTSHVIHTVKAAVARWRLRPMELDGDPGGPAQR